MKVVVTAAGEYINSKFCPHFEECEYLVIYDLEDRVYGSRVSPSFKNKDKATLIDFLEKTFMTHIITGENIGESPFTVYIPKNVDENTTVEDVIIEYMNTLA